MGVVYQARHTLLNSLLAVKILLSAQDEEAKTRFLREARIASQVRHPNTVFISDYGLTPDDRPYLVMEFLQGPTLRDLLERGEMDLLRGCLIGAQIARGLQTVHDKGIVHRDLKPENIFVLQQDGPEDFVKIVDFGIARVGQAAPSATSPRAGSAVKVPDAGLNEAVSLGRTLPGTVMGTPYYMSPEQSRGDEVDARTDQYALGCILFELFTGQSVFEASSVPALLYKHISAPVPSLRERAPRRQIPKALDMLVQRTLAKSREDRFGSLREIELALQEQAELLLRQRGLSRSRPGMPVLPAAPRRRWWLLLPLCVGILAAGALGYRAVQLRTTQAPALSADQVRKLRQQALTVLQADLQAGDPELRRRAVAALGQSREVTLVEPLTRALQDPSIEVQGQAAESLGQLGSSKALPALRQIAEHSPSTAVRIAAAGALDQLAEASGRPLLRQFLHDKNLDARLRAAYLLCAPDEPEARAIVAALAESGKLPDDITLSLLYRLAQSGESRAVKQLLDRLHSGGHRELQLAAATYLVRLGEGRGRLFLHEQLRLPGSAQLKAARALAELDEPDHAELFRQIVRLGESPPEARLDSVVGLGQSGGLADLPLLAELLAAVTAPPLRQAAAVALLQLSEQEPGVIAQRSFQWARTAVADESWLVREAAVAALGDIDLPEVTPLLSERLHTDQEPKVRRRAAQALGLRIGELALVALCRSLDDFDPGVRVEALRSLSRVGQTLLRSGVRGILPRLTECFRGVLQRGSSQEQILARSTLLRLGDSGQREPLLKWQQAPDAAVRQFLVEQADGDAALVQPALTDPVFSVRFAASRQLAEAGNKEGLAVLKEALARGGSDGVLAYGLLRKLGIAAPTPADLESLLRTAAVTQRLATVEALGQLPTELGLPLLFIAAQDPERLVRRLVAEVAADLKDGPKGHPGEPVLRLLASDRDLAVRTRAATLLLRLSRPGTAPGAADPTSGQASPVPPGRAEAPPSDLGPPPAAPPDAAAADQPPSADASPLPATPGGGPDPVFEQLSRDGLQALAAADYGRAQQLFERATARCSHNRQSRGVCGPRATELTYKLARAFESQAQWAEAVTEYQKVARASGTSRAKAEQRAKALEAVIRLSPRLGRLLITQVIKGKCREQEKLLPPGNQVVSVGGQLKPVKLRAGETVTLETCQLSRKSGQH